MLLLTEYNEFPKLSVFYKQAEDRVEEVDRDHAALVYDQNANILELPLVKIFLFIHVSK